LISEVAYVDRDDPRLVESDPVLHAVTESFKTHPCIAFEILLNLLDV
jgi:hypothetical protein